MMHCMRLLVDSLATIIKETSNTPKRNNNKLLPPAFSGEENSRENDYSDLIEQIKVDTEDIKVEKKEITETRIRKAMELVTVRKKRKKMVSKHLMYLSEAPKQMTLALCQHQITVRMQRRRAVNRRIKLMLGADGLKSTLPNILVDLIKIY